MTQPAKVQEPSMEEILASIRRIIADDEAKPAAAEKPASAPAAAKPAVMKDIPPSAIAPAPKPVAAPKPAPPPPPPAPEPAASNNQDDIDAMLASLDAATPEADIRPAAPEADVFELTDEMALPEPAPAPAATTFSKVDPQDDIEFTEAKASRRQPAYEPPFESAPARPILSHSTVSAVESAFNSLANTVLSNNARTLEDLVKEMLRPMLKSWLDDNLPGLVERIVKAEIERVSRGGR
ncbi:cell pole-organizing protein PopZ [Bradyrhizobium sp. AZCC 1678]|uniref:Cell pole-organizing protein PopZ n=1 Tax=Bradyrhizobium algeriense TaxID=634784 RepID=A0ABU8BAN1_9BRAD